MEFSIVNPVRALRERPCLTREELARERRAFLRRERTRQLRAWARVLLANDVWDLRARRRSPSLWDADPEQVHAAASKRWPDMPTGDLGRLVGFALELQENRRGRRVEA